MNVRIDHVSFIAYVNSDKLSTFTFRLTFGYVLPTLYIFRANKHFLVLQKKKKEEKYLVDKKIEGRISPRHPLLQ